MSHTILIVGKVHVTGSDLDHYTLRWEDGKPALYRDGVHVTEIWTIMSGASKDAQHAINGSATTMKRMTPTERTS